MKFFSKISRLVNAYPWPDGVKNKLVALSEDPEVKFIAVRLEDGTPKASVYSDRYNFWGEEIVAIYSSSNLLLRENMIKSKTMQALDLVLKQGLSQYAAAKKMGIHPSAVSRALYRREEKKICPCCQQVVRDGFKVDKKVLKSD